MLSVRQVICQQDHTEHPHAHSHWREAVRLFAVWKTLHAERQPEDPLADPLRGEAIHLQSVHRQLQQPQQPSQTHDHTHQRGALTPVDNKDLMDFAIGSTFTVTCAAMYIVMSHTCISVRVDLRFADTNKHDLCSDSLIVGKPAFYSGVCTKDA